MASGDTIRASRRGIGTRTVVCLLCILLAFFVSRRNMALRHPPAQLPSQLPSRIRLPRPLPQLTEPVTSVVRTRGGNWQVWDRKVVFPSPNPSQTCKWVDTTPVPGGQHLSMCVHNRPDVVSQGLEDKLHWSDCDPLPQLWQFAHSRLRTPETRGPRGFYVEVGANIGACVLLMLLETDARVLAFEPNPENLFCLTSTLLRMPPQYRERLTLFPIALGAVPGRDKLFAQSNNLGNGVLGRVVFDEGQEHVGVDNPVPVAIETLDSIIGQGASIPLVKMDAQGFECKVLQGMRSVIPSVHILSTEIDGKFLGAQGCSDVEYFNGLVRSGFEMYENSREGEMGADGRYKPVRMTKPRMGYEGTYDVLAFST